MKLATVLLLIVFLRVEASTARRPNRLCNHYGALDRLRGGNSHVGAPSPPSKKVSSINPKQPPDSKTALLLQSAKNVCIVSPEVPVLSVACTAVFALWQMPKHQNMLNSWFVCSLENAKQRPASLLAYAVSHASIGHLLTNLVSLLIFGPIVRQRAFTNAPLKFATFLTGSALSSSGLTLALKSKCRGLSGVTFSLLAVFARMFPHAGLAGMRLRARNWLQVALLVSVGGSAKQAMGNVQQVAHGGHLGGLLFGMAWYELLLSSRKRTRE